MGTSKSYGGPADKIPLLPAWALPSETQGSTGQSDATSVEPNAQTSDVNAPNSVQPTDQLPGVSTAWQQAKSTLSRTISGASGGAGTGSGGRFARSAQKYVGALGGSRRAASKASTGVGSTSGFAGFLSGVANNGLNATLTRYGLDTYIGRDADTVFAAITNIIAPTGDTREATVARKAITEALEELYNKVVAADGNLDRLNNLSKADLEGALESAISNYIFARWIEELGLRLEEKSVTVEQAIKLERDMKQFIRETVELDLKNVDVLKIDWSAAEGRQITEKLFQEAYAILENLE